MSYKLKALQIKARQEVYTLLSGNNLSKLHGEGYDFSELREYQIGDDIRKINWTISAKLGKPYIKELHANRELFVTVATLCDGSLYFGKDNKKQHKVAEVASIIAYATQQQNDLFMGINSTASHTYSTPPTKQLYHIEAFSKDIFETPLLSTKLNQQEAIDNLFQQIHKPSLLFIISDFLQKIDLSLLAQKHEVVAIIIRKREEENPKYLGETTLNDPTSRLKFETLFGKKTIQHYKRKLLEHDNELTEHFEQHRVKSLKIIDNENSISKLINFINNPM